MGFKAPRVVPPKELKLTSTMDVCSRKQWIRVALSRSRAVNIFQMDAQLREVGVRAA